MKRLIFILFWLSYAILSFSQNYDYDLTYQKLEFWVDPSVRAIRGAVEINLHLLNASNNVTVDLADELTVDSIKSGAELLSFTHNNNQINISFSTQIQGDTSFVVYYHGQPPQTDFGSFTTSTHNDTVPIMWTLSEPYGARDWFPTKNFLGDKIDSLDVIIHTQPEYIAASNGVLVQDTTIGNERIIHWKTLYPIATYLVAFAVTNYTVYYDTARIGDSLIIPVMNFIYPESLDRAEPATPYAARCLEFYSNKFILYPFYKEKYGQAQFGWGGGMEHQTITFIGGFSQMLLAHELAHHWFGDYITCGSWHEIYLNESFATYLEGLTAEAGLADYSFRDWLANARALAFQATTGSIYVYDTTDVDRIFDYRLSYMKGALFLHMLRWTMGDSAFFQGLREYLKDSTLAYGFAHTADLKRHLEHACNCDLTELFNDWLYGQGYPEYDISVVQSDSFDYVVEISQTPTDNSVDFFELKLPLLFKGDTGQRLVVLNNVENNQTFTVHVPFQVTDVEFDPDWWLLAKAKVELHSGFSQLLDTQKILVYPTLVTNDFWFVIDSSLKQADIKIVDLSGKEHYALHLALGDTIYKKHLDLGSLQSGVYLFKVLSHGHLVKTIKFIKL